MNRSGAGGIGEHDALERAGLFQHLQRLDSARRRLAGAKQPGVQLLKGAPRYDQAGGLTQNLDRGQQQRLTIARALSQEPELLMLDEFSIAVDPVTTMRIEDVLKELKSEITIILVTNLVQQARRLADRTAFFLSGQCVEIGETEALFIGKVKDERTSDYIKGRFG